MVGRGYAEHYDNVQLLYEIDRALDIWHRVERLNKYVTLADGDFAINSARERYVRLWLVARQRHLKYPQDKLWWKILIQ